MPEAARAPRTPSRRDDGKPPRTQQQRRDETRRALLDAAVESLIEVGFARTTTLEVQRRANASRGSLFGKDVADHPGLDRALDFTLQFMIGAAMTQVLHADPRLRDLIDDFKALFPAVLTQATTKRRKVTR